MAGSPRYVAGASSHREKSKLNQTLSHLGKEVETAKLSAIELVSLSRFLYASLASNFDTNVDERYSAFSVLARVVSISCELGLDYISVDCRGNILLVPRTNRCVFLAASCFKHLLVSLDNDGLVGALSELRYSNIGCGFINSRYLYLRILSNPCKIPWQICK